MLAVGWCFLETSNNQRPNKTPNFRKVSRKNEKEERSARPCLRSTTGLLGLGSRYIPPQQVLGMVLRRKIGAALAAGLCLELKAVCRMTGRHHALVPPVPPRTLSKDCRLAGEALHVSANRRATACFGPCSEHSTTSGCCAMHWEHVGLNVQAKARLFSLLLHVTLDAPPRASIVLERGYQSLWRPLSDEASRPGRF
jgi:hypothetical protein